MYHQRNIEVDVRRHRFRFLTSVCSFLYFPCMFVSKFWMRFFGLIGFSDVADRQKPQWKEYAGNEERVGRTKAA